MDIAVDLLKAPHIGVRELKTNLSKALKSKEPLIVTERGRPIDVIVPYSDMVEMVDLIDEVTDPQTLVAVQEGRRAIKTRAGGVPISHLFEKIRQKRK